jgi:hypothetical protein
MSVGPKSDQPAVFATDALASRTLWSQLTDAPLAGLGFAREAGLVLAFDDSNGLYLFDLAGKLVRSTRTPVPLKFATVSDDGSQIIAVSKDGDLWWLKKGLDPRLHQGKYRHLIGVAVSPQGEYLAASMSDSHTFIFNCTGRRCTNLMTHRPLRHLAFLSGSPLLIGVAEYGLAGCYELDGQPRWQDSLWSSAGHVSASGEGYAILVSCFGHGLQRYGLDGTNEGAYHLGGGVARAVMDYDGKLFAAATLEGEIMVVNAAGHVLWRQALPKPAHEIAFDPAGKYLIYAQETGAISLLEFSYKPAAAAVGVGSHLAGVPAPLSAPATPQVEELPESAGSPPEPGTQPRQLREPTWRMPVFDSESQAETAVLGLVEDPARVAVFTNRRRVDVFNERGDCMHTSDKMSGVGRYLDADAQTIVAATDRELLCYDIASNQSQRFVQRFNQITHLRIDSEAGEIVMIEERDLLSRYDLSGKRRWIKSLDSPVEWEETGRAPLPQKMAV